MTANAISATVRRGALSIGVAVLLVTTTWGCTAVSNPGLTAARASVERAKHDPLVRKEGAPALNDAERILRSAEELWEKGGDADEVDHRVYLVGKRLDLARAQAQFAETRGEVERLNGARRIAANEAPNPELSSARVFSGSVRVEPRFRPDGTVEGVVMNQSRRTIRDVELMINYQWLWNDEFRPGAVSPGRTERLTLGDPIPPGGNAPFVYRPQSPLPIRSDGRFEPSVEVVGFKEIAG